MNTSKKHSYWKKRITFSTFILFFLATTTTSFPVRAENPASDAATTTAQISSPEPIVQVQKTAEGKEKIVIFWASIGFGHHSAAQAIEAEVRKQHPKAEIVLKDIRDFQNPIRRWFVGHFYDFMTKNNPKGYDTWYRQYMEDAVKLDSVGNTSVALGHKPDRVGKYLEEQNPTLIISTFNHATEALINLKDKGKLKDIPIAQVLTDYVNTEYFAKMGSKIDMSFVPHEAIRQEWINKGFLSGDKIQTTGMPVNPKAFDKLSTEERDKYLESKNLDPKQKTILLVSGSAGVGNFELMVKSMADAANGEPLQIVAVCARNLKHVETLNKLLPTLPKNITLKVLGLTPQAELFNYMKAADVIVTKTGGLSSSEVGVMQRPAIFLDINGGQEAFNSEFFAAQKMAITTKDQSKVGELTQKILKDPKLQDEMVKAQSELRAMVDQKKIADWALAQPKHPLDLAHGNANGVRGPPVHLQVVPPAAQSPFKEHPGRALFMDKEEDVGNARWDLIKGESKEIFAAYYLWDGNKVGAATLAGLREAAQKRGAKVRVILDGWAPENWVDATLDADVLKALKESGVEIRIFNPVDLSKFTTYLKPGTYNRMHDKLLYLGGQKVLETGDRNVQNINFRMQRKGGKAGISYKSTAAIMQGDAVDEAKQHLEDLWEVSKAPDLSEATPEGTAKAHENFDRYLNVMNSAKHTPQDWVSKMVPVESIQFVHDSPGKKGGLSPLDQEFIKEMDKATDHITVTTPYPNFPKEYVEAFHRALTRKVKVQIIVPAVETTDVKISLDVFAMQSYELQKMGVQIFTHQGPDFLHGKSLEIDGKTAYVGSSNMNMRGSRTDSESGVIVRDAAYAKQLEAFNQHLFTQETKPYVRPKYRGAQMVKYYCIKALRLLSIVDRQF